MANPDHNTMLATNSHDTALCIIPPESLWPKIDWLRSRYDKTYGKWPPHINLIYPFVQVDALPRAVEAVQTAIKDKAQLHIRLDAADVFQHRQDNTVFIHDDNEARSRQLQGLRSAALEALGQKPVGAYHMHMSIGQSDDVDNPWHQFLLQKAKYITGIEWDVDYLHVAVRERIKAGDSVSSQMRAWGTIALANGNITKFESLKDFYNEATPADKERGVAFLNTGEAWTEISRDAPEESIITDVTTLAVATYNVLAEFSYPPSQKRYLLIIKNILADRAKADVIVLQEVTDDFLIHLLKHQDVRNTFSYCSHGPPDQYDARPLPSHNNIIVLSKHPFVWENIPFDREHKGALIVKFRNLGQWDDANFKSMIMAAVHLTCGLKDGSIAAKKLEIERLLKYLQQAYPDHPTILAGDFNITTSSYTISQALEKKAVSAQAVTHLRNLDDKLLHGGFIDSWTESLLEKGTISDEEPEPAFEGEQGATYDPTVNDLAAEIVGSGFNLRPQRYDRILIKGDDFFKVLQFNKFGQITHEAEAGDDSGQILYASDHWGVRAVLRLGHEPDTRRPVGASVVSVDLEVPQGRLADPKSVTDALEATGVIPTEEETSKRAAAFQLLRDVIIDPPSANATSESRRLGSTLVVVPVGSYGLGVWTASSDIDCLCIGPFSSSTFFSLATLRLRKALHQGVKIIRRVKAHTGTMLELDVQGVKMDLQYASASAVAENWPAVLKYPSSHATWSLSSQTLSRLKAVRDIDYVRRSVPDITKFRLAHRFIKTWAKNRGIYTARFGYLGGIQITVLLARVYKLLAHETAILSVTDVIGTFFNHYAEFDWKNNLVFDPFFHKQINYRRTDREPLVILGYYPPSLNTCLAASVPSVRSIAEEFQRADEQLRENNMTWSKFLDADGGADFLLRFKTFIKIDVHFWGGSLTKGRGFVGWVESRCVSLLVDLNKRLPDLYARFWPARWVEHGTATGAQEDAGDYQGCYLIGLDRLRRDTTGEDEKVMYGTLLTILRRFEEQIREDKDYFDDKTSWMSASVEKTAAVGPLAIDGREWGEYTIDGDESDDQDEEDANLSDVAADDGEDAAAASSKKKGKPPANRPRSAVVPKPEGAGRFRTAADVLNRLRWDPAIDGGDYIVGYEDRFAGAMEKGLGAWKSEQTDEEFIPQHRILYFKRKSDGVVAWERRTRTDLLFGSGS